MALDPNIALAFKPIQLNDPLETQVRRQQVQSNALAMRNVESQNALAQRTALEDQAVNKLYAQSYDPQTGQVDMRRVMAGAAQLGLGGKILGMQTADLEAQGKRQNITKDFNANVSSAMDNARFRLEGVRTPEQFMQWHEQNHSDPTLQEYFDRIGVTPEQSRAQIAAAANDPAAFADLLQKAQLGLKGAQDAVNAQANRDTQLEVQGMIDRRVANRPVGRAAAPARAAGGGGAAPAAGKPGMPVAPGKPPTVSEQSAGYNVGRVLDAAKTIKEAVARTPEADAPSAVEAAVGSIPLLEKAVNFTRGADRQIVTAAQRDLLDGLLYLATGAAYNKEQLAGQYESYITQFSDKPEARESKRQRLAQLAKKAKVRVGKAWTPELEKTLNDLFDIETDAGPKASTSAAPPAEAIASLRRNPGTAKQFDEIFGPGAAAKALRK